MNLNVIGTPNVPNGTKSVPYRTIYTIYIVEYQLNRLLVRVLEVRKKPEHTFRLFDFRGKSKMYFRRIDNY